MTQIHPFTGSILQSTQVSQTLAGEKDRQVRRQHNLEKNSALQRDELEHQVESTDQVQPTQSRQGGQQQHKPHSRQTPPAQPEHIDLTG